MKQSIRTWLVTKLTGMTPTELNTMQLMASHNANFLLERRASGYFVPTPQIFKANKVKEIIVKVAPHLAKITFFEKDSTSYVN
jgi:hypothetical protein